MHGDDSPSLNVHVYTARNLELCYLLKERRFLRVFVLFTSLLTKNNVLLFHFYPLFCDETPPKTVELRTTQKQLSGIMSRQELVEAHDWTLKSLFTLLLTSHVMT